MPGECVGLVGASGAGQIDADADDLWQLSGGGFGRSCVSGVDVVSAEPREILALRRETLGYVSQFLRVVPRVPTLDVVAEPLLAVGVSTEAAHARHAR